LTSTAANETAANSKAVVARIFLNMMKNSLFFVDE
jgi:hypothetical protein